MKKSRRHPQPEINRTELLDALTAHGLNLAALADWMVFCKAEFVSPATIVQTGELILRETKRLNAGLALLRQHGPESPRSH